MLEPYSPSGQGKSRVADDKIMLNIDVAIQPILGGGFKHYLFLPLPGEMIQFY